MPALHDPARHEPLADLQWSAPRARDAIAAIARDAESAFDPARLWPLHPADDDPSTPADGVLRGLYVGAAGMLHALRRLAEAGLHDPLLDAAAVADGLHEATLASPDEPGAGASLLVGTSGVLLIAHRLCPAAARADALAAAIAANAEHPANEVLLGAPGTMHAARAMHARTGDERFADLWRASARTLLARRRPDGLWTQDLYGDRLEYVGAAHGFAGNAHALLARARVARRPGRGRGARRRHRPRAGDRRRRRRELAGAPLAAPGRARRRASSGATAPRAWSRRSPRWRRATGNTTRSWPPAAS